MYFTQKRDIMSEVNYGFSGGEALDSITSLIKSEIKKQYGSVQKFSEASGIPYGTVSNALVRGVGSSSYDIVTKICKILNIKQVYDDDLFLFNKEFYDVYKKLTVLDDVGVHTVCSVLNVEYQRCVDENDPKVKGYNGISIVKQEIQTDEKTIRKLLRKVKAKEE